MNDLKIAEKPKVAENAAEQEFDRWSEDMDLNLDTSKMDAEELTAFTKIKDRLIRALQKGSLTINDNGEAVYTPWRPDSKVKKPITFHEQSGAALMAMDGKKKNDDVKKLYSVMAAMCKIHMSVFSGLVGVDIKICQGICQLLMD